jgi:hypothetical protein
MEDNPASRCLFRVVEAPPERNETQIIFSRQDDKHRLVSAVAQTIVWVL